MIRGFSFRLPRASTLSLRPLSVQFAKGLNVFRVERRRSFAHLQEAMRQNNELSVKHFWKQFNVLDAVKIIGQPWNEVSQKTVYIFLTTETQGESVSDPEQIDRIIEEVVDIAKQLNLEVDNDGVHELLDSHNQELTIDEVIEMSKTLNKIIR